MRIPMVRVYGKLPLPRWCPPTIVLRNIDQSDDKGGEATFETFKMSELSNDEKMTAILSKWRRLMELCFDRIEELIDAISDQVEAKTRVDPRHFASLRTCCNVLFEAPWDLVPKSDPALFLATLHGLDQLASSDDALSDAQTIDAIIGLGIHLRGLYREDPESIALLRDVIHVPTIH